ncbi:MAG: alpha/beta hydrolase [Solirubrobacterales bacterium]
MAAKVLVAVAITAAAAGFAVGSAAGPDRHGASLRRFVVKSRFVHRTLHEVAVVPAGFESGEKRPMLVFLHGRSQSPGSVLSAQFFAGLARLGKLAPVVVALDGGDHSYWHDRHGARWGSYVLREAIPAAVKRLPVDSSRVAIGGISMGGYGAFDLARRRRFCAVGGHSPALWLSFGQTAPGAFDNARDFRRHSVYRYVKRRRHPYGSTPLWIDRGNHDPFTSYDAAIVRALRGRGASLSSHVWRGAHTGKYWRTHIARYLRFYARALAKC